MTEKIGGYAGKIIRVNLSSFDILLEPTLKYAREWLGGAGIGQRILYQEVKQGVTPYSPANVLSFGAGPLVGTLAPGAVRLSADSMNALTMGVGSSNCCGPFAYTLKYAGYDHIVIKGKARRPVYLWIDNDKIEIREASHLWGKTTWETMDLIREELGDQRIQTVSIGPAGENLVRGACIIGGKDRALGRCGLGGVMGSKNLKAVAVRGEGAIEVAEPDRFLEAVDRAVQSHSRSEKVKGLMRYGSPGALESKQAACGLLYKNFQELVVPEDFIQSLNCEDYTRKYQIGHRSTLHCPNPCGRAFSVQEGPYAGLICGGFQFEATNNFGTKLALPDPAFIMKLNSLCNQLGLDIDLPAGAIAWAMECYQRGLLTEKETGGLKLEWGNGEAVIELTKRIAHRQGLGDLLAEGSAHASRVVGKGSEYYAMHIKGQDLYEHSRGAVGWGLGACVSTRGGGHTTGSPIWDSESSKKFDPDKINQLIGIDTAADPLAYKGKAKAVDFNEKFTRVCNALGVCLYTTCWVEPTLTGFRDLAELYSAATGWKTTEEDLKRMALRILNMEKAFNLIHTSFDRKDDYPPPREMNEPIPSGSKKGWKLEREKWDALLDEYYEIHGWDKKTSYPTRRCLEDLGLHEIAEDLVKIGKLGEERKGNKTVHSKKGRNEK